MTKTANSRTAGRRAREREARHALIRSAAVRVFARNGYAGTTMEMVADEAELGKATLYYYFKTKQELFAEIVSNEASMLQQLMREHSAEMKAPIETARALCRFWVQHFLDNPDLADLLLPIMAAGQPRLADELGHEVAEQVMSAHRPLLQALEPVKQRIQGGDALLALMSTVMFGLASKMRHASHNVALDEVELLFNLIETAAKA